MSKPKPLVAGNWKMNGLRASLAVIGEIAKANDAALRRKADLLVCPPATLLFPAAAVCIGSRVAVGAQDCHAKESGAHTGDLSAEMIADAGATYVIVGHSERRADHGETDAIVEAKAQAALRAGLTPIICIGETRAEREAGKTLDVVGGQLAGSLPAGVEAIVIAYEPVWAIGTGLTPTASDVAEVHGMIREKLVARLGAAGQGVRILYGGSVKPSNAAELMAVANVDGALVGGASLTSEDFMGIAGVYR
jgi:triosephosphate isomerase